MALSSKRKIQTSSPEDLPNDDDELDSKDERKEDILKIRLALATPKDHPLTWFSEEVKTRGIKNFDLNQFVLAALTTIDTSWWREQLEQITPLEYKISAALADPDMREKLKILLASQSSPTTGAPL